MNIETTLLYESEAPCPEANLWRRVIMQAFLDASSTSKRRVKKIWRLQAIAWLSCPDDDFYEVCRLADIEPDNLIPKIRKFIKNIKKQG